MRKFIQQLDKIQLCVQSIDYDDIPTEKLIQQLDNAINILMTQEWPELYKPRATVLTECIMKRAALTKDTGPMHLLLLIMFDLKQCPFMNEDIVNDIVIEPYVFHARLIGPNENWCREVFIYKLFSNKEFFETLYRNKYCGAYAISKSDFSLGMLTINSLHNLYNNQIKEAIEKLDEIFLRLFKLKENEQFASPMVERLTKLIGLIMETAKKYMPDEQYQILKLKYKKLLHNSKEVKSLRTLCIKAITLERYGRFFYYENKLPTGLNKSAIKELEKDTILSLSQ